MRSLGILASGMVTGVGLDAGASCAAIRCAIDNFAETGFMDEGGEWIVGSRVPIEFPSRGVDRLVAVVIPAIGECLAQTGGVKSRDIALLLCLADSERPGRPEGLDTRIFERIESALGLRFGDESALFPNGRVSAALAMLHADRLLSSGRARLCVIAGVDSLLARPALAEYERRGRLKTSVNPNGFIPGEAAGAVLVGAARADLNCAGIGLGSEPAAIESGRPLRADGLVQAFRAAFADAGNNIADVDYRIADANGEQYLFREAALAVTRTLRFRKELFDIWHPADSIGEVGAAIGPCALAVALAAARKRYAPGHAPLCHFSSDDGERAALVMTAGNP